jgi:hypothetical protein
MKEYLHKQKKERRDQRKNRQSKLHSELNGSKKQMELKGES